MGTIDEHKSSTRKIEKKRSGSNQISHALQRLSCFHFEMWGWSRLAWASGSAFILKCGVGPWLVWGQHFFSTLKHFFSTLTFFFNPATFLFHPRTLFFDPVTFFFNPCTCFFDPGPFFFNPIHLGPPDFPAARSASFTLDGSSSSRLPAYKLWAVGGPIWGLQWSGWVLEAT